MTIATRSVPRTTDHAPIAPKTEKADAPNAIPHDFVPGLAGVPVFTTEIAEPDRDGGALRYRGVNVEDLIAEKVEFGDVWALLVDGEFGAGLPPAERFELPVHSRDIRVDVQAGLAMLAPMRRFQPLLDIDDRTAREQLAGGGAEQCRGQTTGVIGPAYSKMDVRGAINYALFLFLQRDVKVTHMSWNGTSTLRIS